MVRVGGSVPTLSQTLQAAASFRTKQRFPILTWRSPRTGTVLCRAAEPGTWMGNRDADKRFIDLIRYASGSDTLAIFDCRSRIAATGNAVNITKESLGGTEWGYPHTSVTFCGLVNIHKVCAVMYASPLELPLVTPMF